MFVATKSGILSQTVMPFEPWPGGFCASNQAEYKQFELICHLQILMGERVAKLPIIE